MKKLTLATLMVVANSLLIGLAWSQQQAPDEAQAVDLAQAEERLEDARRRLEEAARDVARLSAQRSGPRMRRVIVDRDLGATRPLLGLNIDDARDGVLVVGITPNGAAADAGVRTGDTIISIDGQALDEGANGTPTRRLLRHLEDVEVGDTVGLVVIRDGEELDIDVVTRDMGPGVYAFRGMGPFNVPVPPGGAGGYRWRDIGPDLGEDFTVLFNPGLVTGPWRAMELVALTPTLGEYFGTEDGLLVVRAPSNESLGLLDGDVILEIGGRVPTSAEHAIRILASFEPGEELELAIVRQRRRQTVSVELE